ncbi:MAG: hypothetical protein QOE93_1147, partial [Actinomycetota bacterium]|nr:hypothetical protein [Actinomycetota bacterium]
MFCNQCGHLNVDDANFCSSCGALLEPDRADDTTITFMPGEPTGETPDDDLSVSLDLSEGSAMLVVKRGPNAGSRFLLDQEVTT